MNQTEYDKAKQYIDIVKKTESSVIEKREALGKLSVIAANLSVGDQTEIKTNFMWDILSLPGTPFEELLSNMAPQGKVAPINGITVAEKIAVLIKNMNEDQLQNGEELIKAFIEVIKAMDFEDLNDHKDKILANMTPEQLNFIEDNIEKFETSDAKLEVLKDFIQENKTYFPQSK